VWHSSGGTTIVTCLHKKKSLTRAVSALAASLLLGGCGGAGAAWPESASRPPNHGELHLILHDQLPLTMLSDGGHRECKSVRDLQANTPPVTVTVHDEEGVLLGHTVLPERGGSFKRGDGCTWDVSFTELEPAAFYHVVLAKGHQHHEAFVYLPPGPAFGTVQFSAESVGCRCGLRPGLGHDQHDARRGAQGTGDRVRERGTLRAQQRPLRTPLGPLPGHRSSHPPKVTAH
jgi:hypothetical protein